MVPRARADRGGAVVLALVLFLAASAAAEEPGTVQRLIDAAAPGGTVVVPPGVHREHLRIVRPLTLDGRGAATIDGGGQGTIVSIQGAAVTLRGLTLRASGDSFLYEDSAVKMEGADGCVVEDCRLEDIQFGLYVAKSSRCQFRRLWIGGKPLEMPRRGDGVRLWYSDDTVIEDVEMIDSRDFVIWFAQRTAVRRCRVQRCRYGLHYMYADDNAFEDNVFENNEVGGAIMYSRRIAMTRNKFIRSRGPSAYGMLLKDADDVVAEENEFVDNTRGIYFDNTPQAEGSTCTLRRNLFALNDAGISILPGTRRVLFEANTFVDNLNHVEFAGRSEPERNTWRGNYWGDAPGYDADGDGFSDVAYRPENAYEDLVARHPELAMLRFSPSVGAIEAAVRVFPHLSPDVVLEDPTPSIRPTITPKTVTPSTTSLPTLAAATALALLPVLSILWARRALR